MFTERYFRYWRQPVYDRLESGVKKKIEKNREIVAGRCKVLVGWDLMT